MDEQAENLSDPATVQDQPSITLQEDYVQNLNYFAMDHLETAARP